MHRLIPSFLLGLALAPGLLVSSGCKAPEYPACKKDKHCNAEMGETCVEKTCQNCKTDADCVGKGGEGKTLTCQEFRCAEGAAGDTAGAPVGVGTVPEGGPCAAMLDCEPGLACKAGVCSICSDDLDCDGRACNQETGRCAADGVCQTDDQCPVDEICDGGTCVFSGDYSSGDAVEVCGFASLFFGFDSDKITDANVAKLQEAAACLTAETRKLILEAHADGRGTEEYNILLTDKRGASVKNFLINLGVPEDKIEVIAKGSLEATGSDEATRAKERRVDFIWQ
ncbi:MAG: OmpA family protein [Myxococcales bacterium]|nr:OmpA family protein [Myxococcales bacterium]